MKGLTQQTSGKNKKGQRGFTLVELLVVVGIIVALAAVIIPNATKFAGKGEEGSMAAEKDSVQVTMETMMADKGLTGVTDNGTGDMSTNSFATDPAEGPLAEYLRSDPTEFYYCWDANGLIKEQHKTSTACS